MGKFNIKLLLICFVLVQLLYTNIQNAKEILIYADNISYDEEENLIARGNARIISNNEIINSDLIIYKKKQAEYILPLEFKYKDEKNNYYYGSSGNFSSNLKKAEINNVKILLNDGSRLVGNHFLRDGEIDIIDKGSYSACTSRINIKNFMCPIWQLDGEKILHDNEKLFLYQKHAKMRIFNLPVWYIPYLVTPSPLRKKRKSGFLTSTIAFNFIDSKTPQKIQLPYYFALDIDKELTFTPILSYGGGSDSQQRMLFDYNQITEGGNLNIDFATDTEFNSDTNKQFKDGSITVNYNNKINKNYSVSISSALQTSQTYIKKSDPGNINSLKTSLSTSISLVGYSLLNFNDVLEVNTTTYQVVQAKDNNKTTPTSLPYIKYTSGNQKYKTIDYENKYQFYNIFREISTSAHSQQQIKLSHLNKTQSQIFRAKSRIDFKTEVHNQLYKTENKQINNKDYNYDSYRLFPMSGIFIESPIKNKNNGITITPKLGFIINAGKSNSNKISNEDSTNNTYNIGSQTSLNRYSGTDKLDNSKRVNYELKLQKNQFKMNFSQNYEFTTNSNYHKEAGNTDYLSDALGSVNYNQSNKIFKNLFSYNIRYDVDAKGIKQQSTGWENTSKYGTAIINYIDQKKESNSILSDGNEQINFTYKSEKFYKYNKFIFNGTYNMLTDRLNEYTSGYSYFDECFGIDLDYKRTYYAADNLKPQDIFTIMFSFKNLGSYASDNFAVSEQDKQDIKWVTGDVTNEKFN